MAQRTAVELFAQEHHTLLIQLENKEFTASEYAVKHCDILQQAKEMEKQQIMDAYKADRYPCSYEDSEEYYNQTYKTQAQ